MEDPSNAVYSTASMLNTSAKGLRAHWAADVDYMFFETLARHTTYSKQEGMVFNHKYADADIINDVTRDLSLKKPIPNIVQDLAIKFSNKIEQHRSHESIELLIELKKVIPEFNFRQINNKHINMWTRVIVPFRQVFESGTLYKGKSMFHKDCKRFNKVIMEFVASINTTGLSRANYNMYCKAGKGSKQLEQWLTAMLHIHKQDMVEYLYSCSAKMAFTYIRSKGKTSCSKSEIEFLNATSHTPRSILLVLKDYMDEIVKYEKLDSTSDPSLVAEIMAMRNSDHAAESKTPMNFTGYEQPRVQYPNKRFHPLKFNKQNMAAESTMHLPLDVYVEGQDLTGQRYNDYLVLEMLDSGASSHAWRAEHTATKRQVVLKFTRRSPINNGANSHSDRVKQEAKLMGLFHHPNIARVLTTTDLAEHTELVIAFGGSQCLLHHVLDADYVDESKARALFRQIVSAVGYMHGNCIVHRSLSLEKMMVNEGHVVITNMRFATPYRQFRGLTTYHGHAFYASPEMVNGMPYTGPEVDIWALGVCLYIMLCAKVPFPGNSLQEIYSSVISDIPNVPGYLTEEAQDLLSKMLLRDQDMRISMDDLIDHPWMNMDCDGVVDCHLPERPSVVHSPHMPSINQLSLYNIDSAATVNMLSDEGSVPTAATCAYHLLEEKRLRNGGESKAVNEVVEREDADNEVPLIDLSD
ncbi:hypothetical protein IWW56_001246 [Coemansia sp. RSA 2131]|nr:hypothetical protein IWW56_001246 [Coemansia sp. RSA 2131]